MKIAQQIKRDFAKTLKARVRETKSIGVSGREFKLEILRLLENYINSVN
jgi:hypothetical protein